MRERLIGEYDRKTERGKDGKIGIKNCQVKVRERGRCSIAEN